MCKLTINPCYLLLLFTGSILLSLLLNKLLISFAYRYNRFLDKPNIRSSHAKIVPRCGGIPIYLILLCAFFVFGFYDLRLVGYLLGAGLIAVVGTIDDLSGIKGKPKILGMVLSAFLPLLFGLKLEYLGVIFNFKPLLYLLTFIWIYGFINAFNFMDGIDGLIGGSAAIGAFFVMAFAAMTGNVFVAGMAMLLLSTCMGFLAFNYHPASIFLGDAGSMFLGYNFAVLGVMLTNASNDVVPIYASMFIFAPIIYDSMVTFVRRGMQKKNVIEAHREHLYQRLIIKGFSHRNVSLIYYLLALLFGSFACLFVIAGLAGRMVLTLLVLAIMVGFSLVVKRLELCREIRTDG